MTAEVWACEDCGEEGHRTERICPFCGGRIEKVDPFLVRLLELLEAVVK